MNDMLQFTKRDQITKVLQFALQPTEVTTENLENDEVIERNRELFSLTERFRPAYDEFVKDMVSRALKSCPLNTDVLRLAVEDGDPAEISAVRTEYIQDFEKTVTGNLPEGFRKPADIKSAAFLKKVIPAYLDKADSEHAAELKDVIDNTSYLSAILDRFITSRITEMLTWAPERALDNFEKYVRNMTNFSHYIKDANDDPEFTEMLSNCCFASYYTECLTQEGIEAYNSLISGTFDEKGSLITKGYNQRVIEINHMLKSDCGYKGKYFRPAEFLDKQILFPSEKKFKIEKVESDEELRTMLNEITGMIPEADLLQIYRHIKTAMTSDRMYVDGTGLHQLAAYAKSGPRHALIHDACRDRIIVEAEATLKGKKRQAAIDRASLTVNKTTYSIAELEKLTGEKIRSGYLASLFELLDQCTDSLAKLNRSDIMNRADWRIAGNHANTQTVLAYTSAVIEYMRAVKVISSAYYADDAFEEYEKLRGLTENLYSLSRPFSQIRSYLTMKDSERVKKETMLFGDPSFCARKWWNGENGKLSKDSNLLYMRDGKYYIAFPTAALKPTVVEASEKTDIKALTTRNKMSSFMNLPRMVFNKEIKAKIAEDVFPFERTDGLTSPLIYTREIVTIKEKGLFTRKAVTSGQITEEDFRENLSKLLSFYVEFMRKSDQWNYYCIDALKDVTQYADAGEFFSDVDTISIAYSYTDISGEVIDCLEKEGLVYVFMLTSRHLYRKGRAGSSYAALWQYLMSEDNVKRTTVRLAGAPSVTYTPALTDGRVTHAKGSILLNRYLKDGTRIPDGIYHEIYGYLNKKTSVLSEEAAGWYGRTGAKAISYRTSESDIIKDRRYASDRWNIFLGYVKNADTAGEGHRDIATAAFDEYESSMKKIVITRDEYDLIAYTLFDENGSEVEHVSLNVIDGYDYRARLLYEDRMKREHSRDADVNYSTRMADVRKSFIEHAVSKIAKRAVETGAMIIMEKTSETTRLRQICMDANAYVLFEAKLNGHLCDMYDKHLSCPEPMSVANPLQLTRPDAMNRLRNGIVTKVSAAYTGRMCPVTGYVNAFDFRNIKTLADRRALLENMVIAFSKDRHSLFFTFDFKRFNAETIRQTGRKTEWTLVAEGERERKTIDGNTVIVHDCLDRLKELLEDDEINTDQILDVTELSTESVNELFRLFRDINLNTGIFLTETGKSTYISPVLGPLGMSVAQATAHVLLAKYNYAKAADTFSADDWFASVQH